MTNSDLQQLSKDFFQNSLDSSPTSAIMRGHKQYFDQIEELNEETFEKETKAVNDFISRLESIDCLLYTSPSPRDISGSRMPSSA